MGVEQPNVSSAKPSVIMKPVNTFKHSTTSFGIVTFSNVSLHNGHISSQDDLIATSVVFIHSFMLNTILRGSHLHPHKITTHRPSPLAAEII